jgi:hypothetical protein
MSCISLAPSYLVRVWASGPINIMNRNQILAKFPFSDPCFSTTTPDGMKAWQTHLASGVAVLQSSPSVDTYTTHGGPVCKELRLYVVGVLLVFNSVQHARVHLK